ncbi:class III lanthionine synthetase LanKC [Streptomyces sp. ST2-7A]|uniref:class III lanthionine synthetase LanKC n=1 Tax=Streptomyces sp. ST2-7A TaxID=2907214 RepID=UPI001F290517|nr:class III lanthionine synthetase LanKC [Streptomyces sp. ST2-7A]MCE7081013.1 class III lanthionine synthetase LanKC [Streptomyces sp. ST2-7A]
MDKRYEAFCLADPYFYETPARGPARSRRSNSSTDANGGNGTNGKGGEFPAARRPVPAGWTTGRAGDWLHLHPEGLDLPAQGWKIHVSARPGNAARIADAVHDYCVPRRLSFKFVPTSHQVYLRNSKYAPREAAGKFVTLYPEDTNRLRVVLEELDEILKGETGPYVLSDLRWREGPLYVRYGGFTRRLCADDSGALVPALENAEGELVPDLRRPGFHLPPWVTLPDFLEPALAARNATTVRELPYRIERALHFSNGGGVYSGTDTRTGEQVVLKEARPHAGLAADGVDAVARLEREAAALERLDGLDTVPRLRDGFTLGDHRFLVMDHLPGRTLNSFFAERHPLLTPRTDRAAIAEYTRWALGILAAVERAVTALHERGVVFNDLHMFNIMVAPDETSVALLDFETASYPGAETRQLVAHPGFLAPADRSGPAVDRYALACLRLAMFLPLTSLLGLDRGKAAHLAELASGLFPDLPAGFLDAAVAEIEHASSTTEATTAGTGGTAGIAVSPAAGDPPGVTGPAAARRAAEPAAARQSEDAGHTGPAGPAGGTDPGGRSPDREALVRAILDSADPGRVDRLFPGDIAQFSEGGGSCLAHGAAGVLYALAEVGADPYPEGERWLLDRVAERGPNAPLGLYDGLGGVALALHRLGHAERALELTDALCLPGRARGWEHLPVDLFGGLAGIGLTLDHLADAGAGEAARRGAESIAERFAEHPSLVGPVRPDSRAGLLHGASGAALFLIRRYERDGERARLDAAGAALRRDLSRCVPDRSGTLLVDEGSRLMPYVGAGSVGIAMVLDAYLAHRPEEEDLARARAAILPAARSRFYVQPGLFRGRAGMILHLTRTPLDGPAEDRERDLAEQVDAMAWYAVALGDGTAFPGDQMMRLSMDLATGTAGCLLALTAARQPDRGIGLPFLPPLAPRGDGRPHERPRSTGVRHNRTAPFPLVSR